jgi:signal transduction histidine kinase/CheY-like chemotaxis protein/PAS domain-containing protein
MQRVAFSWVSYLGALLAVAVAGAMGALLAPTFSENIYYVTFFTAVALVSWFGGLRPALLAIGLIWLVANLYVMSDERAFRFDTGTVAFLFVCLALAMFSELARRARLRAATSAQQVVSVVESIADGFIAVDSRWICTYLNRAAEELSRRELELTPETTLWDVFPLAENELAASQIRQAATLRETVEFECFHQPWQTWFEVKVSPAEDRTLAVFFRDITERKLGQMALTQSEERLRLAQSGARAGLWDWDMVNDTITWSQEFYEINGIEPGLTPSQGAYLERILLEDREPVLKAVNDALQQKQPIDVQYRIEHPLYGIRWIAVRGKSTFDENGRVLRTTGIALDITDRKRAETALAFLSEAGNVLSVLLDFKSTVQSVARLATRFVADYCLIDMVNERGRIERVAHAHRNVAQEPLLRKALELNPLDWDSPGPVVQALRAREPLLVTEVTSDFLDQMARTPEHREILHRLGPATWMVVPLVVRDKVIGAITFVGTDRRHRYSPTELELVSELGRRVASASDNVRLYTELCESQRQKDDFLAMLAHELRNPLAAIQYANQLATLTKTADDNPATEVIDRQVKNLAHLIDDLLDVSRITRDKIQLRKEAVDGRVLIERALATVGPSIAERRHELSADVAPMPLPLYADPVRVEQILVNLLSNAAKYTPEGGKLSVRAFSLDGQVVYKIKDTGIGIPPEMLPRVFELFTQVNRSLDRSQGGLGIGLTVVRKLAEMHGGSVSVTSEGLGQGSEFTVRLPLASATVVMAAEPAHAEQVLPLKILVVDDNVDMANSLAKLLEQAGHTITMAHDGLAALAAARRSKPDAVVLDIGLPGLDGYRVAEALRREPAFANVRLVAVSGYGQAEDRSRAKAAGFDHHLVKPVDLRQLVSALASN